MSIYLLRHGQIEWSILRRFQGDYDSPLTEAGRLSRTGDGQTHAILEATCGN